MARSTGILILVALGSAVVGVLFGFLLFQIFRLIQNRRQALFQKKISLITTETAKQPSLSMAKVGIAKPSAQKENAIKILLKNHTNTVISENRRISTMEGIPPVPEFINQKNTSMVEAQKQSSEPNVLNLSEIISQKNFTILEEPKESPKPNTPREQTIVDHKNAATSESQIGSHQPVVLKSPEVVYKQITPIEVRQNESSKSDIIQELETNLAIATTPWSDKLRPFQTSSWNFKHAEDEPLLTPHIQDLIQLYMDVGLANNIVWMATEFGHRSKELDESYIKLCTSIAERIKGIMPS